eukprot:Seg3637.1 transcript_id=Seg3637.1/GoldUCD/mRNA.D3Y31 product="hypothetical protein" protein_id=Seg3637.1/GoldUCD/D3Y31
MSSTKIYDSDNSPTEISDGPTDNMALLNVMLVNPEYTEHLEKPTAIRKNFFCTLNSEKIPIDSALADDNGAYLSAGKTKKLFYVNFSSAGNIEQTKLAKQSEDGSFYYNHRTSGHSKPCYEKQYVPEAHVYELCRTYRKNKANPALTHMIVTARRKDKKDIEKHYVSSYRVHGEYGETLEENFIMPRHGNATRPTAAKYFRTEKKVLKAAASALERKMSADAVYKSLSTSEGGSSVSAELRNPRQVHNIKSSMKATRTQPKQGCDEIRDIVNQMRDGDAEKFTRSITILPTHYYSVHYLEESLKDIERFCVDGNSVQRVDTTFEIIDNCWVTDTSYTNESLVSESNGKHPEFPGPIMLHFRKDQPTYRAFASSLVAHNPRLLHVKKFGTDMDKALSGGFGDIFQNADRLTCLQHVMERDSFQLGKMGATKDARKRILTDIYGSKQERIQHFGLVDADDAADFNAKLTSLKEVWDSVLPGFHDWFAKRRSDMFKETIVEAAKDRMGLEQNFFNNRLEVMHKLQKKMLSEAGSSREVTEVRRLLIFNIKSVSEQM